MNLNFFHQYLIYSASAFLSFFSMTYASDSQQDPNFLTTYDRLKTEYVTPEATPVVDQGYDCFIDLAYILWQPSQGGLAYSIGSVPLPSLSNSSNQELVPGRKYRPNFELSSGFKVAMGCDFDYDGWSGEIKYTWYTSQASSSFSPSATGGNNSLWEGNFSVLAFGQTDNLAVFNNISKNGKSDWSLFFNTIDLDISRQFFISRALVVNPYFGFKGAWMIQKYNILYYQEGISTLINISDTQKRVIATAAENYTVDNKQRYWGVGPLMGISSSWLFSKKFSMGVDLKFSSLWSHFDTTRIDFSEVVDLGGSNVNLSNYNALNQFDKFYQLNNVIESCIALNYEQWFSKDQYRLGASIGWETQMWFDQNQFIQQGIQGNLSLQGLLVSLRFDF